MRQSTLHFIKGALTFVFLFGGAYTAYALVNYPPGSLLQPSDVATTTIRNFAVTPTKIASSMDFTMHGLTTTNATSTNATTTTLAVTGGTLALNGVVYTTPSADGTPGQSLTTDGARSLSFGSPASQTTLFNVTAGQSINKGQPVILMPYSVGDVLAAGSGSSDVGQALGGSGTQMMRAEGLIATSTAGILSIDLWAHQHGTPADNQIFTLQTDKNGSPSGSVIATTTVASNSFPATCTTSVNLPFKSIAIQPNTTYWIVNARTGTYDGSNYVSLCGSTTQTYPYGLTADDESGTWGTATNNWQMIIHFSANPNGYLASSLSIASSTSYIGIANATVAAGASLPIVTAGMVDISTSTPIGSPLYLSDKQGALSNFPGTNIVKIGRGIASTTIMLTPF